ncbi:hypothetical protein Tco_0702741 [Tanacetum coccineum]|uniref:Uncharacterized protein n=1 Tax=Tanacetum coccineum TaxID=301880 RepID=A0ABQ4XWW4_9ASTR
MSKCKKTSMVQVPNTRPPMLARTDIELATTYSSVQSRKGYGEKYYGSPLKKDHFKWERFQMLLLEELRVQFHQVPEKHSRNIYVKVLAKLINDIRNIKMTMSRMQLNQSFVNNMLPECRIHN